MYDLPMVLEDAGYQCSPYTDPVQALQEFKPCFYDLILLDIKMPLLGGFELYKKIRGNDKNVKVIFITASEFYYEQLRRQQYPSTSYDINIKYLQKPIGNDDLLKIVNRTMAPKDI
jgi:CheY-like chemotaxis protein